MLKKLFTLVFNVIVPGSGFMCCGPVKYIFLYLPMGVSLMLYVYFLESKCCEEVKFQTWVSASYGWLLLSLVSTIHLFKYIFKINDTQIKTNKTLVFFFSVIILSYSISPDHFDIIQNTSESMADEILVDDDVVVDLEHYKHESIKVDDIVMIQYNRFGKTENIFRRAIAVKGDVVCFSKKTDVQPKVTTANSICNEYIYEVGNGEVFLAADNHSKIFDLSWHGVGPISIGDVDGKAVGILFSSDFDRWGVSLK